MNGNLEELLAPLGAGALGGIVAHISYDNGSATIACTLSFYVLAQGLEYLKKHPIRVGSRLFANETRWGKSQGETTVFNLQNADGSTGRISSVIPFSHWQRVGEVVMQYRPNTLTTVMFKKAFPNWPQEEQRALHAQMTGLLSVPMVDVIVKKDNGWNVITHPKGWGFFSRVSRGMVSPLEMNNLPYTPPQRMRPENSDFNLHTPSTHAILNPQEGWKAV